MMLRITGGRNRFKIKTREPNFQFKSPIVLIVSAYDSSLSFKLIPFMSLTASKPAIEKSTYRMNFNWCKQSCWKLKFNAHMLRISIQLLLEFVALFRGCLVQLRFLIAFTLSSVWMSTHCWKIMKLSEAQIFHPSLHNSK